MIECGLKALIKKTLRLGVFAVVALSLTKGYRGGAKTQSK